ncbi:MAG: hypothetical protein QXJ48_01080 [Candidatus Korarchaeum sp.]
MRSDEELQMVAVSIAKSLMREVRIPRRGGREKEGKEITMSNLRNMLKAAEDCIRKRNWDLFALKVIYVAREASPDDDLFKFVKELLEKLNEVQSVEERLILAKYILTSCIYLYNAYREGLEYLVR